MTDANACEAIANITLDIPQPLAVTSTIQNPACPGDFGAIDLTVVGGIGPFTYRWDFGSIEKNIQNLI